MNEKLTAVCEQFISDRDAITSVLKWENHYILPVGAFCGGLYYHALFKAFQRREC